MGQTRTATTAILDHQRTSAIKWYIPWTVYHDHHPNYQADLYVSVLKSLGIQAYIEPQYGWDNQPDVVTFKAPRGQKITEITEALEARGMDWPIVWECDF